MAGAERVTATGVMFGAVVPSLVLFVGALFSFLEGRRALGWASLALATWCLVVSIAALVAIRRTGVTATRQTPGGLVGAWMLEEVLARTGDRVVAKAWKGDQPGLLKLYLNGSGNGRERRLVGQLDSGQLTEVVDGGPLGPGYFVVYEWLQSKSLAEIELFGEREELAARVLAGTAASMRALERKVGRGVIHGDIQPRNVLVTDEGAVVLCDYEFLSDPNGSQYFGPNLGASAYQAPEVVAGGSLDRTAEIFGLGALGYFSLKGEPVPGDLGDPDLPEEAGLDRNSDLEDLIARCLGERAERPDLEQLAAEANEVLRAISGKTAPATKSASSGPGRRVYARWPRTLAFVSGAAAVAVAVGALLLGPAVINDAGAERATSDDNTSATTALGGAQDSGVDVGVEESDDAGQPEPADPDEAEAVEEEPALSDLEESSLGEGEGEGSVRLFDFSDAAGNNPPWTMDMSADGALAASGNGAGDLLILNSEMGELICSSSPHSEGILDVDIDPADRHVLSTSFDGSAVVSRIEDCAETTRVDQDLWVRAGAFSSDGQSFFTVTASAEGTVLYRRNTADGSLLGKTRLFEDRFVNGLVVVGEALVVPSTFPPTASGSDTGYLTLVDVSTEVSVVVDEMELSDGIKSIAASASGEILFVATGEEFARVQLDPFQLLESTEGNFSRVKLATVGTDAVVLSSELDGSHKMWTEMDGLRDLEELGTSAEDGISASAGSPSAFRFLGGLRDGGLARLDWSNNQGP